MMCNESTKIPPLSYHNSTTPLHIEILHDLVMSFALGWVIVKGTNRLTGNKSFMGPKNTLEKHPFFLVMIFLSFKTSCD